MRTWPALVVLALVLSACTTTRGSPASPTAPVVPVPEARPAGGAYGRLMDASGHSVPGGAVTLTQPFDDNIVLLSVRLVSLGMFCLIPDAGLCPSAHGADVSDDGLWSVPADEVEPGKAITLGGHGLAPEGGMAAFTSVSVPNGRAPVHVPDIVLWQPDLRVSGDAVSWPALTGVPHGRRVRYDVYVVPDAGAGAVGEPEPVRVATGLRRTRAVVPGWQVEDKAYRLTVVASTRRGRAAYVYTSPSASGTGTSTPLSRGRPCSTDRGGRQVAAAGTCPLTDGDLVSHEQVRLRGECSVDRSSCRPPHHTRICVDLGRSRTGPAGGGPLALRRGRPRGRGVGRPPVVPRLACGRHRQVGVRCGAAPTASPERCCRRSPPGRTMMGAWRGGGGAGTSAAMPTGRPSVRCTRPRSPRRRCARA